MLLFFSHLLEWEMFWITLKAGFSVQENACPFCLSSQLSYIIAFTVLRCASLCLNSIHKQDFLKYIFSSIAIHVIGAGKNKCPCSFPAVASQCCLPGTPQVGLIGWQPWEQWQLLFRYSLLQHWPHARPGNWAREVGSWRKLLHSVHVSPEYKSSNKMAMSEQEHLAAAA